MFSECPPKEVHKFSTNEPPLKDVISGVITTILKNVTEDVPVRIAALNSESDLLLNESDCSLDNSLVTDGLGEPTTISHSLN